MTIFDEISIIANQLANQGKTPSVALVKSKLNRQVALPQIISALKSWQHDPDFTQANNKHQENTQEPATLEQANELGVQQQIERALMPITKELAEIKVLLQQTLARQEKNK